MTDQKTEAFRKRAARKTVLTKEINTVMKFVRKGLKDEVEGHRDRLKTKFAALEEAHDTYHALLEEEPAIAESDAWFDQVEDGYVSTLAAMQDLKEVSGKVVSESEDSTPDGKLLDQKAQGSKENSVANELVTFMNLPKLEIEKYDGNPLKYHTFCATFDEAVGRNTMDATIKLTRLLQHTTGKAHAAISHCVLTGGESGYKEAWDILKVRFGDHYLISDKVIQNLRKGAPIKTADDLLQLSDELINGLSILKSLDKLQEIDTQSSIVQIVDRLQPYLRNRWRRDAMDQKREKSKYPGFDDLVKFVQRAAEDAVDPVYGQDPSFKKLPTKDDNKFKKASSFVTTSSQEKRKQKPCILCGESHRLFYCQTFKSMKPRERLDLVRQRKLCENCLLDNHSVATCRKPSVCSVPGCNARHTKFIHVSDESTHRNLHDVVSNQTRVNNGVDVIVPTVPVVVNAVKEVSALLDTASNSSFCSKWLADSLGLRGKTINYVLNTMSRAGEKRSDKVVTLDLTSRDGKASLKLSNVYVVDNIPASSPEIDYSRYPHLRDLNIVAGDVHVLIGQDHSEALVPMEIRRGHGGPFAVKTLFGWSANGPALTNSRISRSVINHFVMSTVEEDVHRLWDIENDVCVVNDHTMSEADREVVKLWDTQARFVNGHYELPIPWKSDIHVPNNIGLAEARLKSLCVKLEKSNLFDRYDSEIQALLERSYAEPVPIYDISKPVIWYLPHHCVLNKKGKFRVVFDCAAKFQGESLNQKCHQGPEVNNKLVHVLLRFRENDVALMADVESMYHQVCVPDCDKDALRFLWIGKDGTSSHFRMTRHLFGGVWSGSAATYALRRTVTDFGGIDTLVDDTVMKSFYVDDCLKSVESSEEAVRVMKGVKSLLQEGGFCLTKFVSNDPSVICEIPEDDRAKEYKDILHSCESKALGVKWNFQEDDFWFDLNIENCDRIVRRKMLSTISSMYDPLGIVSPVLIAGKMILQDATRLKLSWDEEVPAEMRRSWACWLQSLGDLRTLRIPRCIKPGGFNGAFHELHHFSDASEKAYGSCSYLRSVNKDGEIHTALVFSKSRVAPIKSVTIPRLELQAAVLSARIDCMLHEEMSIELAKSYFWIDSEIALKYIRNDTKRFHVYVSNRVGEIRRLTEPDQWHHISGKENPADIISRGQTLESMDKHKWFQGPDFLRTFKSDWKRVQGNMDSAICSDDPEVKREPAVSVMSHVVSLESHPLNMLIEHFSSWTKLRKAVAWLIRLKDILKSKRKVRNEMLSVQEFMSAETVLLKHVQAQSYDQELRSLLQGNPVNRSSALNDLCPVLNSEGVLCVGGRLRHAELPDSSKFPVILPHKGPLSEMISREMHCEAHLGLEWTLSLLRQKYWITQARSVVKRVISQCVRCKRLNASLCNQKMADLPVERVRPDVPAFSFTGLDCFGPFLVKSGRSEVKRYGCIFTCLSIRAVHLEVLDSMTADSFLNGFRRFVSRRGEPVKVWSDNGSNIVAGQTEMAKAFREINQSVIHDFALKKRIEWKFNPPCASHMGGAWERLIRSVRKVFVSLLMDTKQRLTDEILRTLFCEVESILNNRPITKLSSDCCDLTPLTPNHLLLMREGPRAPPGQFSESDMYRRRWKYIQHLKNQFWQRWLREYLPELQRRQKWCKERRNFQINDLVLIRDESTPRHLWPLALVVDIQEGRDGLVRSLKLKTKSTTLVRPVTKVVLLEGV